MNRPNGPLSPLSSSSNDSFAARSATGPPHPPPPPLGPPGVGGLVNDAPYSGGPYGVPRPKAASPPGSQHPSSSTDMSRPSGGGSSVGRPPSSASSVGRSSHGGMSFGPPPGGQMGPPGLRDSTRSQIKPDSEEILQRHYAVLKGYLSASLRDEKGNIKPNRARDKLLRLSVVQFMELSTDVFDELVRREDDRLQRVPNVPRSLPPKQTFHPKRNQARQKLSTLPIERFRQLATDVFYELERRIPRFVGGVRERSSSLASNTSRGGMRPPPGYRGPPPGGRPPYGGYGPPGAGLPPGARPPQPKTSQSNTLIPNKSTMVEDDEDSDSDEFGLDNAGSGPGAEDNEEISQLREQLEDLQVKLLDKEKELDKARASGNERETWQNLREELEQKQMDAQKLNDDLRHELDQLLREKHEDREVNELRSQLEDAHRQLETHQAESEELRRQLDQGQHSASQADNERRIELLRTELATQEKLTHDVRDEAMMYLNEMRELSRQNDRAIEQEEKLAQQMSKMEREVEDWRHRYARLKAQNKSLRASTMGLNLPSSSSFDAGSLFRKEGLISDGGLVKDVDITRFQMSVDELLQAARQPSTAPMLDRVKNVAVCVQSITSAIGTDGYPTPSPSPRGTDGHLLPRPVGVAKLRNRVTGTANSLITATKQHASSAGLAPVALLDAAASNLTAAVVDLIKAVGIRPSSPTDLADVELDPPGTHARPRSARDSMASFYDDSISPVEGDDDDDDDDDDSGPEGLNVHVSAPDPPPAKPGLGRSNTMKKWFGWGGDKGQQQEETHVNGGGGGGGGGGVEHDPYL